MFVNPAKLSQATIVVASPQCHRLRVQIIRERVPVLARLRWLVSSV